MSRIAVLLLAAALVSACHRNDRNDNRDSNGKRDKDQATTPAPAPAPSNIASSFTVRDGKSDDKGKAEKSGSRDTTRDLKLKKSSLGKTFMLVPSMKSGDSQWTDFSPAIIVFEKSGDSLGLFEVENTVYDEIKAESLLGTFKIKEETETEVVFEWTLGLKSLPMASHYVNPFPNKAMKELEQQGAAMGVTVKESFVRKAVVENNELHIEQVSRIQAPHLYTESTKTKDSKSTETKLILSEQTVVADFQIRPYEANTKFQKRERDEKRRLDFFAVKGVEKGRSTEKTYAMHWDLDPARGPIQIQLSKDVPALYREAVKEGALYWNRVVGREIFVTKTDLDQQVPSDRSILIRWIKWEDAGFAYASMQADPMNGEVIRAQVFMTSGFVNDDKPVQRSYADALVAPLGLGGARLCEIHKHELQSTFEKIDDPAVDAAVKQDLVRMVIAHEVGHTLGLRHNFAASHGVTTPTDETFKEMVKYKKDVAHPGVWLATTVMDYQVSIGFSMLGRFIKNNILGYDKMALDYLETAKEPDEKISPFCSDEDLILGMRAGLSVYGCAQRDWSGNLVRAKMIEARQLYRQKVGAALDEFYKSMFPKDAKKTLAKSFDEALKSLSAASPSAAGQDISDLRSYLFLASDKEGAAIETIASRAHVKSQVPGIDPSEQVISPANDTSLNAALKSDLASAGGYAKFLREMISLGEDLSFNPDWAAKEIAAVIAKYPIAKGQTIEHVPYEITAEQAKQVTETISKTADASAAHIQAVIQALLPAREKMYYDTAAKKIETGRSKIRPGLIEEAEAKSIAEIAFRLFKLSVKKEMIESLPQKPEIAIPYLDEATRKALLVVFDPQTWSNSVQSPLLEELKKETMDQIRLIASASGEETNGVEDLVRLRALMASANANGKLSGSLYNLGNAQARLVEAMRF